MAYITSAERLGIKKGLQEGLEKGLEKGIRKGRQEGKEEGIVEGKLETAVNMLREGFDWETVKKLTGLTEEHLAKIEGKKKKQ